VKRRGKLLLLLGGPALLALFIALMLMVAYPNALKLGAPFLCADDRPDAFVVRYDVQTSDGTGTNFTLICMSERGEIDEVGTWKPLLVLYAFVTALVFGALIVRWLIGVIRGAGSTAGPPPGPHDPLSGPDPFAAIREQEGPIIS